PAGDTAGAAENSVGFVFPVTLKCTVWPLSFGGPALMPVAQFGTLCAPLSSSTVWSAPVMDGASAWIGCTSMRKVCAADETVPPLSWSRTVIVDDPNALGAGV